jgi:hypothetical protein
MSEVEIIRELCREITEENDPEKTRLLLAELREMIALASDETRLRLGFLVRFLRRNGEIGERVDLEIRQAG